MKKGMQLVRVAMIALATVGVVLPQAPALAAGKAPTVKMVAAGTVFDINMKGGVFAGRVVDHTGAAIEGAEVIVKQGQKEVTRTVTDKSGSFAAANLKNGVYTVQSGNTAGTFRAWSEGSAPPSAKPASLLVMGENNARGQIGSIDGDNLLMTAAIGGVAIAGLVTGIVAINKANDNKANSP